VNLAAYSLLLSTKFFWMDVIMVIDMLAGYDVMKLQAVNQEIARVSFHRFI
jgi:hypothetical protein